MKKVILSLFALSTIVASQAQIMSSNQGYSSLSKGLYNSDSSGLDFSGKISTERSESIAAVDPTYTPKTKSLFNVNLRTKSDGASIKSKDSSSNGTTIKTNKLYFSWNFIGINEMPEGMERDESISFSAGYSHATNLFREILYVDYGAAFSLTSYYLRGNYYTSWSRLEVYDLEVRVPINLMANIKLTEKIYLRPHIGFSLRLHFDDDVRIENIDNYPDVVSNSAFNTGFQYGVGFAFNRIYLGVERRSLYKLESYNYDTEKIKLSQTALSIGFLF